MAGLYYEQFSIGQEFEHPWTRTVSEMDNTLFSALTMNVQPLHIDAHFTAGTEFGQRIVNSMFTRRADGGDDGERHHDRHDDSGIWGLPR